MINDFLEQNELENVFHIDSDNVLLTNISNLEFHKKMLIDTTKSGSL